MDSFDRIALGVIAALALAIGLVAGLGDHVGVPVTDIRPADRSQPAVTTPVSMTFGEAMEAITVESRFSIDPPMDGTFAWHGPTLTFTPARPFQPGTTYTVTLGAGAIGDSGRQTKEHQWTFTPRQPRVVYLAPADQTFRGLWVVPLDGSQPPAELFHAEWGIYDFAVRPDGSQIALTVYAEDTTSDIWLVNADGSDAQIMVDCSPGSCSGPAWSPDGKRLAYERAEVSPTSGLGPTRVWLFDPATGSTAPVFEDNQVLGFGPAWSPDGRRLAFFDGREGVIRVVDVVAGGSALIPSAMGEVGVFSPDGLSMVYVDIRQVGAQFFAELYLASFGGETGLRPLFENAQEDQWPAWSPVDDRIAFGRRRLDRVGGFGSQLVIYDLAADSLNPITDDPAYNNLEFAWDPTGRHIVFTRFNLDITHATPELWVFDTARPDAPPYLLIPNALAAQWLP